MRRPRVRHRRGSAVAGQCGECINLSGSGEPCSRQQPCAEGLQCDVELETCQQATPAVATGQACESSFDSGTLGGNCANPNDLCINEVCTTVQLAARGKPAARPIKSSGGRLGLHQ